MRVFLKVENNGSIIPLTDGFPYEVGDIVTFKEEPEVAYKIVGRKIETSKNNSSLLVDEEPVMNVTVIYTAQRGKMIKNNKRCFGLN